MVLDGEPVGESVVDFVGEGAEFVGDSEGESDEGDEVGGAVFDVFVCLLEDLVCLPEVFWRPFRMRQADGPDEVFNFLVGD